MPMEFIRVEFIRYLYFRIHEPATRIKRTYMTTHERTEESPASFARELGVWPDGDALARANPAHSV